MAKQTRTVPVSVSGLTWRPLTERDAGPLYDLLRQLDDAERASYRTSRDEVDSMLARKGGWEAIGGYSADAPTEMLAFGYVGVAGIGSREVRCEGGVHPSLRGKGVGRSLLRWQTKNGTRLLREAFPGQSGFIVHSVSEGHRKLREGLKAMGYKWSKSYSELRLRIEDIPPKSGLPSSVKIVPWTVDLDNLARRAYNRATAEIGAETFMNSGEWEQLLAQARRGWSFLAVEQSGDRPEVVGLIAVGAYEQDWEFLGWSEGVVELIAVVHSELRDEIVLALVRSSMKALKKSGMDKVVVSLDPVEDESMLNFYTSLGFDAGSWYYTYQYEVPAPRR